MSSYPREKRDKRDKDMVEEKATLKGRSDSVSINSSLSHSETPSTQFHSQVREVRDASSHVGRSRHHRHEGSGASSTSVSSSHGSTATLKGSTDQNTGNPAPTRGAYVRERFQSLTSGSTGGVSLPSTSSTMTSMGHSHSQELAVSSPLSSSMVSTSTSSEFDSPRSSVIAGLENLSPTENIQDVSRSHHRTNKERNKEPISSLGRMVVKVSFGIAQSMNGPEMPKRVEEKLRKDKERKNKDKERKDREEKDKDRKYGDRKDEDKKVKEKKERK